MNVSLCAFLLFFFNFIHFNNNLYLTMYKQKSKLLYDNNIFWYIYGFGFGE